MRILGITATLALVAIAGAGSAQQTPAPVRRGGYLTAATAPKAALVLPVAPTEGTERYAFDRTVFRQTRAMEGTPRWALAARDNELSGPALLRHFSCAAGANLTPQNAPVTARLVSRTLSDAGLTSNAAKDVFKRRRPFQIEQGKICVPVTSGLENSYDYPSGHATIGWAVALVLAEAIPDRAEPIIIRGRSYGESRVVCGMHSPSAIEAARTTGALTVAAQHGSEEFAADMHEAKAEIARVRTDPANAVDAAACGAERDLIAATPYPQ